MKVKYSSQMNAFGGINLVLKEFDNLNIGGLLNANLPKLYPNSKYCWKDIFYSFSSIFYCGGQCIEDAKTVLSNQFSNNPIFKLSSPDTIVRRFKMLACQDQRCYTPRGKVEHQFNSNDFLNQLNIKLLKNLGMFNTDQTIIDYDNTILFNEKQDSKMTYKKAYGYQPGVCLLNEDKVLFIENRNGNSDAKSFQVDTLSRMFALLRKNGIKKLDKFRADAASYQYEVVRLVEQELGLFYIGTKNSYVEKYYSQIDNWIETKDQMGEDILIGHINYTPFEKQYRKDQSLKKYRLLVKKKLRPDGQVNAFTNEAYDYHSVITNDFKTNTKQALSFYYHRGAAERQFDVLKNDFGWNNLPFSKLSENTVFLHFSAICNNLYKMIIIILSSKYSNVKSSYRMKRFIFNFIAVPAKWLRSSRQWHLRIYGKKQLRI